MTLQFVTGVDGMLTYPTSYLCKPENMKASKEVYRKYIRGKMHSIGYILLTKHEVSTHKYQSE